MIARQRLVTRVSVMAWREFLQRHCGPGLLGGVTWEDWRTLRRENGCGMLPRPWLRSWSISQYALLNSRLKRREQERFGDEIAATQIQPPLFVLGHWRSGTTHLHELLSQDERFAFPNNYQCVFPHGFLSTQVRGIKALAPLFTRRRPMDNMTWTLRSPQEDEFALLTLSLISPYLGWIFHQRRDHYDRHLTLRDVPESERSAWRSALRHFMQKLTLLYRRPLILKSPTHTARIKLLVEMFPQAKFIHIHRNPYAVFASTRKMLLTNFSIGALGKLQLDGFDNWMLRQYRTLHDAFFAERELIPPGQYCEVSFEQLEREPLEEVRRIYQELQLPDFADVESRLRDYLMKLSGYQKNSFPALPEDVRARVREEWGPCFTAWGYE